MNLKKIVGLSIICATVCLNASMVSAVIGNSTTSDNYESKERGIIAPFDKDGDGVLDEKDKCLDTLPCDKVDENGCTIKKEVVKPVIIPDVDEDKVLDNVDKCLDTPKGFEVDETGCSKLVDLNVQFDMNKWEIKEQYTSKIKQLIHFMENHPEYVVVIEGHTDSDGSSEYNKKLSEARANAVTKYIVSKGIASERLNIKAYGESRPLNSNTTKKDKQENRRVIAVLKK